MNPPAAAATEASSSISTLSGATGTTANENDFMNSGGNMVKVEQKLQNVKFTVHRYCTAGDHADDASKVGGDTGSSPIISTNVFATLLGMFGLNAGQTNPTSSDKIPQQQALNYDLEGSSGPRATITEITSTTNLASSPVLDTSSSSVSPLTESSFAERYIHSMLEYHQGYPLYEPDPDPEIENWREGIKAGDVGLITEDGCFDFLFNVCPSTSTSTNPEELPDDFETLRSPEMLVKKHFQSDTRLFNNGVKRTEGPNVKYTWTGPEGGVLELPFGATRFEAKNKFSFKRLAARHAENWYRYTILTRERDAPNGSLYIVTSSIKCTNWGIAAFGQPSNSQDYLRFVANEDDKNGQSSYDWEGSGPYIARIAQNPDNHLNQCVFLRGYKIMLRKDIWENIVDSQFPGTPYATMSPYGPRPQLGDKSGSADQDDSSSNESNPSQHKADNSPNSHRGAARGTYNTGNDSCVDGSVRVILSEYSKAPPPHPSDLINAILLCRVNLELQCTRFIAKACFQQPMAKVALTHDDDWCDLLKRNPPATAYSIDVDEYGCASLKLYGDLIILFLHASAHPFDLDASPRSSSHAYMGPTYQLFSVDNSSNFVRKHGCYCDQFDLASSSFAFMGDDSPYVDTIMGDGNPYVNTIMGHSCHMTRSLPCPSSSDGRPYVNAIMGNGSQYYLDDTIMGDDTALGGDKSVETAATVAGKKYYYPCECGHVAKTARDLTRHREGRMHSEPKYKCSCGRRYTRKDSRGRHEKKCSMQMTPPLLK